jgi:hypothetical protein
MNSRCVSEDLLFRGKLSWRFLMVAWPTRLLLFQFVPHRKHNTSPLFNCYCFSSYLTGSSTHPHSSTVIVPVRTSQEAQHIPTLQLLLFQFVPHRKHNTSPLFNCYCFTAVMSMTLYLTTWSLVAHRHYRETYCNHIQDSIIVHDNGRTSVSAATTLNTVLASAHIQMT